jgi:hypothetical protein
MRFLQPGLLLLCFACSNGPSAPPALRDGSFQYAAFTESGQRVLEGRLRLTFPNEATVTGTWSIDWAAGADTTAVVGPQVGSGQLAGTHQRDTLVIELNPGNADNNVGLVAVTTSPGWRGEWEWVTLTGPRSKGTFMAER